MCSFDVGARTVWRLAALVLLTGIPVVSFAEDPISLEEQRLAIIPTGSRVTQITFSQDGKAVAFVEHLASGKSVVVTADGHGDEVESILRLTYCPNSSKRIAYVACEGILNAGPPRMWVVCDGKAWPQLSTCFGEIAFSSDGRELAYAGTDHEGHSVIVADGAILRGREKMAPAFNPHNSELAFAEKSDGGWRVVGDTKPGARFDAIDSLSFSPSGEKLAYSGNRDNQSFLVVDGKETPVQGLIGYLTWTPDGTTTVYALGHTKTTSDYTSLRESMVVGDKSGPEFNEVGPPAISNTNRVAFWAMTESASRTFVVVENDRRSESSQNPPLDQSGRIAFSNDGEKLAYVIRDKSGADHVVCGAWKSKAYEEILVVHFSPDASRIAFGARMGSELWWKIAELPK